MFWKGFAVGSSVCLAITLTAQRIREWRERSAFIAGLSPVQRESLGGFETIKGDWRAFRDLVS